MQMKKTHDAAMVIIERIYGARPRFNYYIGTSQGGREALTVAQRYPADYDGIFANVPIVGFSTLMLAPELIRIHEKPLANWVTPAKVNAIRGEFMRQCDGLDGLADGIINNYMACRAIFDVTQGAPDRTSVGREALSEQRRSRIRRTRARNACLTDGQISTLELVYSRYRFATPLAHGAQTFGMWVPNTDPSGSGLILNTRFRGQEGAAADAAMHSHLGVLGVTGFLMKDLSANPLDYVEGGALNRRRAGALGDRSTRRIRTCRPSQKRGGKMIVTIGTNDTLASPGAQLDYYQSVLDKMGRATRRSIRAPVRDAAGRPRPERHELRDGRRRAHDPQRPDSEPLRSGRPAHRLGGERHRPGNVGHGHRRREEPSPVLLSDISTVRRWRARRSRLVSVRPMRRKPTNRSPARIVATRSHR